MIDKVKLVGTKTVTLKDIFLLRIYKIAKFCFKIALLR